MLFEQELMDVLPAGIRSGVRQLGYAGPVSLQGTAVLRGGAGLPLTAGWDVVLDVESGTLRNELKLDEMHGAVRLTGEKTANDFYCRGELEIDSLMCRGVQVTQIRGPLWLDSRQMILGSRAGGRVPGTLPAK